ncbi:hypothetical protein HPB49_019444 [Dermacentor silvarum]|uniref:Uncharacterized protein n=1 Tax=Dermacentor silvarum TaxID=543639 RepID=A0ACB8CST5_DERSI|nr:hypothetical protein HPB49_019444 [Dermacentor silvarum]
MRAHLARYLDASSPGKHRTSQSTLPDQYAEDLSVPKIYLGESRRINPDVHASVVDRATAVQRDVPNMVSLTNVTKKMLRDDSFVEECVEHDFAFISENTQLRGRRQNATFAL